MPKLRSVLNRWVWRKNRSTRRTTRKSDNLSTINPIRISLRSNQRLVRWEGSKLTVGNTTWKVMLKHTHKHTTPHTHRCTHAHKHTRARARIHTRTHTRKIFEKCPHLKHTSVRIINTNGMVGIDGYKWMNNTHFVDLISCTIQQHIKCKPSVGSWLFPAA